jgi:hypothetical protein
MVVFAKVKLSVALIYALTDSHLLFQLLYGNFRRFKPLISGNLRPQLIGSVFKRVIPYGLPLRLTIQQLKRIRPDLLSIVKLVIGNPSS